MVYCARVRRWAERSKSLKGGDRVANRFLIGGATPVDVGPLEAMVHHLHFAKSPFKFPHIISKVKLLNQIKTPNINI